MSQFLLSPSVQPRSRWLALALSGLAGCVVGDFDLEDRACPCESGFVCDVTENRCVRPFTVPDASPIDMGIVTDDDTGVVSDDTGVAPPDGGLAEADSGVVDSICASPEAAAWVLCDGFEGPNLDNWQVRIDTGDRGEVTIERQSDIVYRGSGAMRARVSNGANAASIFANVFTPPAREIWIRAFFYIPKTVAEIEFMAISDRDQRQAVVASMDVDRTDFHTHFREPDEYFGYSPVVFPHDQWFCARLNVVDGENGRVNLYFENLLLDFGRFDTRTDLGYSRVDFGFVSWRNVRRELTREVIFDEVVVSTSSVSCR